MNSRKSKYISINPDVITLVNPVKEDIEIEISVDNTPLRIVMMAGLEQRHIPIWFDINKSYHIVMTTKSNNVELDWITNDNSMMESQSKIKKKISKKAIIEAIQKAYSDGYHQGTSGKGYLLIPNERNPLIKELFGDE
jgi:hypothetical protein